MKKIHCDICSEIVPENYFSMELTIIKKGSLFKKILSGDICSVKCLLAVLDKNDVETIVKD